MSDQRHAQESLVVRWCMAPGGTASGYCGCTEVRPDPASPCGHLTFGEDRCMVVPLGSVPHWERSIGSHPHVPTLCMCGHRITGAA